MPRFAFVVALALLLMQGGCAAGGGYRTLPLPRPLEPGDTAFLEVQVGQLAAGQEIELSNDKGRPLGVISPYGIRPGREAGTYTFPLPAEAVGKAGVRIQLKVTRAGAAPRAPTDEEVQRVWVRVSPGRDARP